MPTSRRPLRFTALAVITVAALLGLVTTDVAAATCLRPPVEAPISLPFDAPACPWCAGHRGITYAVEAGTAVRAAAGGTVTFSGVVVDVRYVVIRHADGLWATYGGLSSSTLDAGDVATVGSLIGRTGGELYFGLRTGPDTYIDPQPLLGELVVPAYLVPTDRTPRRAPPEPVLRCRPI